MAEPFRTPRTETEAPESRGERDGARVVLVKQPKAFVPRFADRSEARKVMKQITEDHREIIEALAK